CIESYLIQFSCSPDTHTVRSPQRSPCIQGRWAQPRNLARCIFARHSLDQLPQFRSQSPQDTRFRLVDGVDGDAKVQSDVCRRLPHHHHAPKWLPGLFRKLVTNQVERTVQQLALRTYAIVKVIEQLGYLLKLFEGITPAHGLWLPCLTAEMVTNFVL